MNSPRQSDNEDDIYDESGSEIDDDVLDTPRRLKFKVQEHSKLITHTSFDAYFVQSASTSKTSNNLFSEPPLSPEEYAVGISSSRPKPALPKVWPDACSAVFAQFFRELSEGFNLLFYGYGSKRVLLNRFATQFCATAGHVVVVNAFNPNFALRDLVNSIENVPGVISSQSVSSSSGGVDNQTRRIYDFFAKATQKHQLYLVIHNIDAPGLRTPKAKSCLSLLAHNPRIHIVASIDHINAPLLWTTSDMSTRKQDSVEPMQDNHNGALPGYASGYAWLWHDLTTLAPYDFELAHADRSSLSGAHSHPGNTGTRAQQQDATSSSVMMTETAAQHILASVTQRAKKLFVLMATKQLERMDEASDASASASASTVAAGTIINDLQPFAIAYDMLFSAARDNFIATNDTALRSLLGEFRDHRLVLAAAAGAAGGEMLWIPLRKERLDRVLKALAAGDGSG